MKQTNKVVGVVVKGSNDFHEVTNSFYIFGSKVVQICMIFMTQTKSSITNEVSCSIQIFRSELAQIFMAQTESSVENEVASSIHIFGSKAAWISTA